MVDDNFYMDICLNKAWNYQGLTYPNPAVGSLILDNNNKIISIAAHKEAGKGHAELNVISKALEIFGDTTISTITNPSKKHQYILDNHDGKFINFTIYVTLEPCNHTGSTPPCSALIKELGFKKIVIGSLDPHDKASGGANLLEQHGINVKTGVLKDRCQQLIEPFKKWQQNKPYTFFKLAITKNGVYTGGTISSKDSRVHVHKLRDKIDLLVIGGNTVRVDRPTLDCRLIKDGKAPDVLIYSKSDDFDKNIQLFKVKNRKVFIEDNFDKVANYKFVMFEGGEGLFQKCAGMVDSFLIYQTNFFKLGKSIEVDFKFKTLHTYQMKEDIITWYKRDEG